MKIKILIMLSICLLAFILRVYKLGEIPSGFYSDESLYGYEAYSILKTGKDQYGNRLPVVFKAFGDFRPGLFIYTIVPFISIGGVNELATRMPSAIFSVFTVLVIFFLSLEIWKSFHAAAFSSLFFTISPWSLQFARMSHETNLATFLTATAVFFFLKGMKKGSCLILSFLFFSLSLYSYYPTRIFVPLWIFSALLIYRKYIYSRIKHIIFGTFLLIIFALPLLSILTNREMGWSRVDAISIWGDPGITLNINEFRGEDGESWVSRFFHNKIIDGTITLSKSFLSHFEPQFLLFTGDPQSLYHTPNIGIITITELILIIIAIFNIKNKTSPHIFILFLWVVIGLLPDTMTRLSPAAPRIHLISPAVALMAGYGIRSIMKDNKRFINSLILGLLIITVSSQLAYFLHQNFIHVPIRYAKQWHYGLSEVADQIRLRQDKYDKIWISKEGWGWINYLFYLKYPPEKIQKEIVLSEKNEYGLGWVWGFGKYVFDDFPQNMLKEKTLFIGTPGNFSNILKTPLYTIYYPNREPAFYIADSSSFLE